MAIAEVYIKDPSRYVTNETNDIITARTTQLGHIIIDAADFTIRLKLSKEEALSIAHKLTTPPNP